MSTTDTRQRLLDSAERLFAEKGIASTSLRALTREADVNLASVHYHFGSKEALLDAVVERRAKPVNDARICALRALDSASLDCPQRVESILEAFLLPIVTAMSIAPDEEQRLGRLVARIEAQPPELVEALFRKHFGTIVALFIEALQETLPHLRKELVADRFRYAAGLVSFLFSGNHDLDVVPGHPTRSQTIESKIAGVVCFIAAGLRAADPDGRPTPVEGAALGGRS